MEITYISDYIQEQLKNIKNNSSSGVGSVLLSMSSFLLDQIKEDPAVFKNTDDERALTRSFLRCSRIARQLSEFAENYSFPVIQKSQKAIDTINNNNLMLSDIEEKCKQIETSKEKLATQKVQLETANNELLRSEEELEQRRNEYNILSEKVSELNRIRSEITDEKLADMRAEKERLIPDVEERKKEEEQLSKNNTELQTKLDNLCLNVKAREKAIDDLNNEVKSKEAELDSLNKELETNKARTEDLTKAVTETKEHFDEFKDFIEATDRIADAIKAEGYVFDDKNAPNSFFTKTEEFNERVKDLENEYDMLIRSVVADVQKLLDSISERQEPVYTEG